ncbi:hypothetical protein [Gemmatimonas sp.]|uniref:hypothetical protein n=1 Tax=Gemmatimonas sp. TaxID=1962908 RepID=UPI00286C4CA0|nr:hypothetical protein [Gemmatimonas sp.]
MMHCVVVYEGVPIGHVELPEGRDWSGGLLDPLAGYDRVRSIVEAAGGTADLALRILRLPRDDSPRVDDLEFHVASALQRLALLHFELCDEAGLTVPAVVVRVADLRDVSAASGDRSVRVHAHFRYSLGTLGAEAIARTVGGSDGARFDV